MAWFDFFWTDDALEHIAEHGVSREDFERVVCHPFDEDFSRSSGDLAAFGYTEDGRYIIAVYEMLDDITVLPTTSYEVPEPNLP